MKPHYRKSRLEDIKFISKNLREADRNEIKAVLGTNENYFALLRGFMTSKPCYTMLGEDNEPFGVCGAVPTGDKLSAAIWMMATDGLDRYGRLFARESRKALEDLNTKYPVLFNAVDARNTVHIRWLKWLGFIFLREIPEYGAEQRSFYEFCRVNTNV